MVERVMKMGIDVRCKMENVRGKKEESIIVDDESQPKGWLFIV